MIKLGIILKFGLLFAAFGFFINFIRQFEKNQIYFPYKTLENSPDQYNLPFEDIYFKTEDGFTLHGWYIYSKNPICTILFCHGNAGNISHRMDDLIRFHRWNINVFIFDYRGYGKSAGSPSEKGTYLDAQAAYSYLINEKGLTGENIVVFGRSLGAAVATDLCTQVRLRGLIIESAFTSVKDMAKEIYPFIPKSIISTNYSSLDKIKTIGIPKLILHSADDEIIPFSHGRRIFEAAKEPKKFFQMQGGHNEGFMVSKEYNKTFFEFINTLYNDK